MNIGKRINERLSIGNKIGLLLAIMVIVAGINVGAVYYYQSQAETLGTSVNYAGQQRMLSQRMAFTGYMISQGHDDQEMMQAAIDKYDRNLEAISNGGEINGQQLQPAPEPVRDELNAEAEFWQTYKTHAQTLVNEDPYNDDFQDSLNYLVNHRTEFFDANQKVVNGYSAAGESYMDERHVAEDLRLNSQRIVQLALEIKHATSQPGTESSEKVQLQRSGNVQQLQSALSNAIEEYDSGLTSLESGGTYDGTDLDSPPSEAAPSLATLTEEWSNLKPHATTVATESRLNPSFWNSLAYVETNSDKLKSISDDAVVAFSKVSTQRIGFMQQILVGMFGLNLLVFLLGFMGARRMIGNPVEEIAEVARELSEGNVAVSIRDRVTVDPDPAVDEAKLNDELKHLTDSFQDLGDYLSTVGDQAQAIAAQDFDADVLDEDVPGTFGESIDQMATDVEKAQSEAEAARVEVEELNSAIESKAQAYNEAMEQAAGGDLTTRVDPESRSEAMTEIGTAFNDMIEDIEKTILQVQAHADEAATSSREVATSTDEIEAASADVAESVQEISQGADEQADRLQTAANEMNDLSATVEEIASSADEVTETAQHAVSKAETGRDKAEAATDELDAMQSQSEEAVDQVTSLNDEIAAINEIVQMISEIAEQTNLLALNASIEAARAGEAGDGFAVVADEIKTLANEAADATEDVEELIEDIQASTDDTVEDIELMVESVEEGSQTIEEAIGMFDEIADTVEDAESGVTEISRATDDQAASTEEVVAMVEEVSDVSEQTAAEATNVSSATEEQTASINSVSENVSSLSTIAAELHAVAEQFEVDQPDATTSNQERIPANVESDPAVSTDGGSIRSARDPDVGENTEFDWRGI